MQLTQYKTQLTQRLVLDNSRQRPDWYKSSFESLSRKVSSAKHPSSVILSADYGQNFLKQAIFNFAHNYTMSMADISWALSLLITLIIVDTCIVTYCKGKSLKQVKTLSNVNGTKLFKNTSTSLMKNKLKTHKCVLTTASRNKMLKRLFEII